MPDHILGNGLILTDWADRQAKAEASAYAKIQRQRETRDDTQAQAVQTAANAARQQYASGDYTGARQTAAAGNAWDVWKGIDDGQKEAVGKQITDIANGVAPLLGMTDVNARTGYYDQVIAPMLKTHGADDNTIASYRGRLGDNDFLDGIHKQALGYKEIWEQENREKKEKQDHVYKMDELGAGLTASPDGTVIRNGTGVVVHGAGIKPELVQYKDEAGNTHITPYGGAPGASPGPGAGGNRTMGWTPRGVDNNSHASVDNKIGLISNAVGAAPDAPLSKDQFLSLNMTALEGKPAGQHNYGNMKNTDGSWKQFNSPQEYQAAQRAWLNRRWNEGARTVRDAVEGRVIGGKPAAQNSAGQSGDINLGGGRTGPLWVDETRQIGNQNVAGQRNQQTGEFKPLGGPAATQAAKQSAKDYDTDISSINNTISLTERLYHHPGLNAVVGLPGLTGGLLGGKIIPGTDAAGFASLMKNFDANAYLSQVAKMKGLGALSDAEGARLSAAIGSLSTSQSENEFKSNLAIVRKGLETARDKLTIQRNAARGTTSQAPSETRTVNGRTYVKVPGGWKAQ